MKVLVTGGTGFIGSHTCVELLNEGYEVVIIDNFYNSKKEVLNYIEEITHKDFTFYQMDVQDEKKLRHVFEQEHIDAVIHFAGYKAVGESVEKPLMYYENNLNSTLVLCKVMEEFGCKHFIFSSSATVYGTPHSVPIKEDFPLSTTNPYGTTKLMIERILSDLVEAHPDWCVMLLRYFNPIGAHESGLLGEEPRGIPNNLMPYIIKVANHELDALGVFGNDYPTVDGTGVRDYIHVVDLAKGHVKALNKMTEFNGVHVYNLGTGRGYSVLELVKTFEEVNQVEVPYQIKARRPGDIAMCYADTSKAKEELGWQAQKDIQDMCRDAWHFLNTKRD